MGLDGRADIRENLFGGKGAVRIWNCLPATSTEPFTAALWCELEPGGSVGRHRQTDCPEVVLCLGGSGRAVIGDRSHALVRGALVHLPLGAALSLHNDREDEVLEYVIIKAAMETGAERPG
ncbi:MAG: hypothetical protein QGG40_16195 [Myxococcota bacterium]|jgi:quercetin dioxygenase-like cupin family protein|nr:hypothetical protein [Myxococcota bacterium]